MRVSSASLPSSAPLLWGCLLLAVLFVSPSTSSIRAYYNMDDIGVTQDTQGRDQTSPAQSTSCDAGSSVGPITEYNGASSVSSKSASFGNAGRVGDNSGHFLTPPFSIIGLQDPQDPAYSSFSIAMWAEIPGDAKGSDGGGAHNLLFKENKLDWYITDGIDAGIFGGNKETVHFSINACPGVEWDTADGAVEDGGWFFIVIVFNAQAQSLQLYLNGQPGSVRSCGGIFLDDPVVGYTVGNGNGNSGNLAYGLDGDFDELMFFDHPLTSSEVSFYYQLGKSLPGPGPHHIFPADGELSNETSPDGYLTYPLLANETLTFNLTPTSGGVDTSAFTYAWEFRADECSGGDDVPNDNSTVTVTSNIIGLSYLFASATFNDLCESFGVVLKTLPIDPSIEADLPSEATYFVGEEATLSINAIGYPTPIVQWQVFAGYQIITNDTNSTNSTSNRTGTRSLHAPKHRTWMVARTNDTPGEEIWNNIESAVGQTYTFNVTEDDWNTTIRALAFNTYGGSVASNRLSLSIADPPPIVDGDGAGDGAGKDNGAGTSVGGLAGGLGTLLFCLLCVLLPCVCIVCVGAIAVLAVVLLGALHSQRALSKTLSTMEGQWEIEYEELDMMDELGSGAFGTVYRGVYRDCDVAVKQMKDGYMDRKEWKAEAALMKGMRAHLNVIRLYGVCTAAETPMCLVTEYMPGGDLLGYLRYNGVPDEHQVNRWAVDIAAGMLHLAKEGIIHRDLAARNLLLAGDLTIKVADFGMSSRVDHTGKGVSKTNVGPVKWMAPELLVHSVYSEKSDVYAYGITLYELLSGGESPYGGQEAVEAAMAVVNEGLRPPIPHGTNPVLADVMRQCWATNPKDRPTFKTILNTLKTQLGNAMLDRSTSMLGGAAAAASIRRSSQTSTSYDYSAVSYEAMTMSNGKSKWDGLYDSING